VAQASGTAAHPLDFPAHGSRLDFQFIRSSRKRDRAKLPCPGGPKKAPVFLLAGIVIVASRDRQHETPYCGCWRAPILERVRRCRRLPIVRKAKCRCPLLAASRAGHKGCSWLGLSKHGPCGENSVKPVENANSGRVRRVVNRQREHPGAKFRREPAPGRSALFARHDSSGTRDPRHGSPVRARSDSGTGGWDWQLRPVDLAVWPNHFLRCLIRLRIRRFLRPTLRRPLPRRRLAMRSPLGCRERIRTQTIP